jgi:hypothetical protein
MRLRLLPLIIAFALLSVNLLSVDFDGGMFEGKGIEKAFLPRSSGAEIDFAKEPHSGQTRMSAPEEGETVSAFEVPFTLVGKHLTSSVYAIGTLPLSFTALITTVQHVPLLCPMIPRGPPRQPTDIRSFSLRAPPTLPLSFA